MPRVYIVRGQTVRLHAVINVVLLCTRWITIRPVVERRWRARCPVSRIFFLCSTVCGIIHYIHLHVPYRCDVRLRRIFSRITCSGGRRELYGRNVWKNVCFIRIFFLSPLSLRNMVPILKKKKKIKEFPANKHHHRPRAVPTGLPILPIRRRPWPEFIIFFSIL